MTPPPSTAFTTAATLAADAVARQRLFDLLDGDYPHLPVGALLNAIVEAVRALLLCGTGEAERAISYQLCRQNLDAFAAAAGVSKYSAT